MNKKIILPIAVIVILFSGWLGFDYWYKHHIDLLHFRKSSIGYSHLPSSALAKKINVSFFIDQLTPAGGWAIKVPHDFSVLQAMRELDKQHQDMDMQTKSYEGLGVMVVSLGKLTNGQDNKYWQYYVNGEMPLVGADSYILKDGDQVRWDFKKPVF